MRKHFTLVAVALCMLAQFAAAQEKYSKISVKVPIDDRKKLGEIIGLLQIDHYQVDDQGGIVVEVGQKEIERLKTTGLSYTVIVDDIQASLKAENDVYYAQRGNSSLQQNRAALDGVCKTVNNIIVTPAAFQVKATFGGYYSYAEMTTAINTLVATYPTLASVTSIGKSVEGRDIWAVKISDNVATDDPTEPDVLFMGLQHAREAIGGSSMIFFMQYLCERYAVDTRIKSLVDSREFYIIPCVNPDGWEYNRLNGGAGSGWRKNRRLISGSNYGVDLNRNYSVDWGTCGSVTCGAASSCGSNNPADDTYYGTSAFSEPETKAIRDFVYTKNFVAAIDQHSYGPYYSIPYGKTARTLTALEKNFYTYIPALMGEYNGMRAGNSCESVGYEVAGGIKDWWLIGDIGVGTKGKIWGMTGEGGAGGGISGTYGSFWAPAAQIVNLCKGMTYQNLQLAYAAGSYADIQDVNDPDLATTTGNLNFSLTRVGLADAPITVSLVPLANVSAVGSAVTISSLPNYYDKYTGAISYTLAPGIAVGQQVRYAWKIQTGGYTYYDTVTKYYQPAVVFSDDMEGTSTGKWTFTGGWGYTNDYVYLGSKSLAESPGANYPASVSGTTRMATYAGPTINLTGATAALVSFWVRHRAENFRDLLNVEVSVNGTTWTPICGTTTVQEPGTLDGSRINAQPALTGIREIWTHELFDLSAYLNTANLRFRFRFTSDANTTGFAGQVDQGFNIDNFKIIKTTTPLTVTLPVQFLNVTAILNKNSSVSVDWDVKDVVNHDHFEVERSTDGINFQTLYKYYGIGPYYYLDQKPQVGTDYYRIRQVDIDGKFMYSPTKAVVYKDNTIALNIYPNPVKDQLTIELSRNTNQKLQVMVTDLMGRVFINQSYDMAGNGPLLRLNMSGLPRQYYIVKVSDQSGQAMAVRKIIRD